MCVVEAFLLFQHREKLKPLSQIEIIFSLDKAINLSDFNVAVTYFHRLLLTYPVILFIDSLDQLTDNYLARSKLSFLVGVKCHPGTRIVVSALPDDKDPVTGKWGKYVYLCDTRLAEWKAPRVVMKAIEVQSADARSVLSNLLLLHSHKLTNIQTESVLASMEYEPSALYLALAVNVIRHWPNFDERSNVKIDSTSNLNFKNNLRGTVSGLINQIFDQLEVDYGSALTRSAVAFITFSRSGSSLCVLS
jgi:hypothetical protein